MQSRWSDADAQATIERFRDEPRVNEDIALRVYTSRLIGGDPALVLHGGGNTSVKTTLIDDTGKEVPVLCVKGSGWDLGSIEPAGLPAVRLESLGALRERDALSDEEIANFDWSVAGYCERAGEFRDELAALAEKHGVAAE